MGSRARRFKHWAYLNAEGRELWGEFFDDRRVPVLSMICKYGPLGSEESPPEEYFMIYWEELTTLQKHGIVEKLAEKFETTPEGVAEEMERAGGLPLRRSLTDGSGTNHPGFFL